MKTFV